MFGIDASTFVIVGAVGLFFGLLQWCLGYAVFRWTPAGKAYEQRLGEQPGRFMAWSLGATIFGAVGIVAMGLM